MTSAGFVNNLLIVKPLLFFIEVFLGHVIFRHFTGANFLDTAFPGILDARNHPSLERVPLFDQFVNAFRIHAFVLRQALKIA